MLWDTFAKVRLALCKLTRGPLELSEIYCKCVDGHCTGWGQRLLGQGDLDKKRIVSLILGSLLLSCSVITGVVGWENDSGIHFPDFLWEVNIDVLLRLELIAQCHEPVSLQLCTSFAILPQTSGNLSLVCLNGVP